MHLTRFFRATALLLITLLVANHLGFASKPLDPAAVKDKVLARGVGQGVRVTLADKTETKGVIVNIGDQAFTVTPKGSTTPQEIPYAQVTGIHKDKMGTGTKVIIVVAVAVAAIGITAIVLNHEVKNSLKNINLCPNNECTYLVSTPHSSQ